MKKLLLAALAPCLIILFTAAQAETVLRRGNLAEPGTLDPQAAVSTTQYWIGIDLYEGLSALAPDGKANGPTAIRSPLRILSTAFAAWSIRPMLPSWRMRSSRS